MGISDMSPRRESRGTRARDSPLPSRSSSPLASRPSTSDDTRTRARAGRSPSAYRARSTGTMRDARRDDDAPMPWRSSHRGRRARARTSDPFLALSIFVIRMTRPHATIARTRLGDARRRVPTTAMPAREGLDVAEDAISRALRNARRSSPRTRHETLLRAYDAFFGGADARKNRGRALRDAPYGRGYGRGYGGFGGPGMFF